MMVKRSLLAIDPGFRTGWPLFSDIGGWYLLAGGVVQPTDDWAIFPDPHQVVIENPVIYPHSKARPRDILTLARIVGRYQERFANCPVELVEPRSWKGTVPGDIMCRRIEAALGPRDRGAYDAYTGGYKHNMTDAVGLGLWALKQPFMRVTRSDA